jgi:hypothetical protein
MSARNTRKGGQSATKGGEELNLKAEIDIEAIATAKVDVESMATNKIPVRNKKRKGTES